jgi:hypothetical protein
LKFFFEFFFEFFFKNYLPLVEKNKKQKPQKTLKLGGAVGGILRMVLNFYAFLTNDKNA